MNYQYNKFDNLIKHVLNRKWRPGNQKGFSIPLVVFIVFFLAIILIAVQYYSSQGAYSVHRSINIKKAEYIAEAGFNRMAGFLSARGFNERPYKKVVKYTFGYVNSYVQPYGEGEFRTLAFDFPSMIKDFNENFTFAEYIGTFIWSVGTYRDCTRILMGIYFQNSGRTNMFNFKTVNLPDGAVEYNEFELN